MEYQPKKPNFNLITVRLLSSIMPAVYNISINNADRLYGIDNVVLMPNHQSYMDIPLEAALIYKVTGRGSIFVMKENLPWFLDYGGGIRVRRPKDIDRKTMSREEVREATKEAREINENYVGAILYHIRKNEIVVVHPEGTRKKVVDGEIIEGGKPQEGVLNTLLKAQKKSETNFNFVPLNISYINGLIRYVNIPAAFDTIEMTVGLPIQTESVDELVAHLVAEIKF